MKKQKLFEKTVGILVHAFRNDKLQHGNCRACAVGNIVAANMGIDNQDDRSWTAVGTKPPGVLFGILPVGWAELFITVNGKQSRRDSTEASFEAIHQVAVTGYTVDELAKVEFAFETAPKGMDDDEWMLNGLLAVYDVLCEIHEVDTNTVPTGKEVFA